MDIKKRLNNYYYLTVQINMLKKQIEEMHELSIALGGFDYSSERIKSYPNQVARYTKTIEALADMQKDLSEKILNLEQARNETKQLIDLLEDETQWAVLTMRYIMHMRWDRISEALFYEPNGKRVLQIHRKAIKFLETLH